MRRQDTQKSEPHLKAIPEIESLPQESSVYLGEPLIGVCELASFLAVPATWVYERTSAGTIPHFRVGRYIRFRASEIESWLREHRAA